jgi:hypothetical protein
MSSGVLRYEAQNWDNDRAAPKGSSWTTCDALEFAVEGLRDYQYFLSNWASLDSNGAGTKAQQDRPVPSGLFQDNTTYTSTWVDIANMPEVSAKYARPVNNVALALPHAGIAQAALDPRSNIIQP